MTMPWKIFFPAALLALSLHASAATVTEPPTLSWGDISSRPLPTAGERIAYGALPQQFGELRLPEGKGPFPIVVLLHGGCWLADFDYAHITPLAAALTHAGYATWTVEYRRIGDTGGGWPNTFLDAGLAVDHLRELAKHHPLDLHQVIFAGHSAGGQLALWLAARGKIESTSPLYIRDPLLPAAVIGLAAITDLAEYRVGPPGSCHASVDQLLGGTAQQQPARYAQTSPQALLPLTVPAWLLQGERDIVVSADSTRRYARAAGNQARLVALPAAGHFEMVVPEGDSWAALLQAMHEAIPDYRNAKK
jgi:acetyl esterase/lipase